MRSNAKFKKRIKDTDPRLRKNQEAQALAHKEKRRKMLETKNMQNNEAFMWYSHNTSLGPPFHVLLDTNFINFSLQNKLEIRLEMLKCLNAKGTGYVTDCVMAEIEKLGPKFNTCLRIAKDPGFKRLKCMHKGTYADDCLTSRVTTQKCWIVATCDKDLKRRIRKIPGVPIMYIHNRKYAIEKLPQ